MRNYLLNKELPTSDADTRGILLSHDQFYCEEDILYRIYHPSRKTSPITVYNQVVVPESLIPEPLL
jgi:hypothetical protein